MSQKRIRAKEKDAIIQSLKSGVTPKIGIQHIQVGRVEKPWVSCRLESLSSSIKKPGKGGFISELLYKSLVTFSHFMFLELSHFRARLRALAMELALSKSFALRPR